MILHLLLPIIKVEKNLNQRHWPFKHLNIFKTFFLLHNNKDNLPYKYCMYLHQYFLHTDIANVVLYLYFVLIMIQLTFSTSNIKYTAIYCTFGGYLSGPNNSETKILNMFKCSRQGRIQLKGTFLFPSSGQWPIAASRRDRDHGPQRPDKNDNWEKWKRKNNIKAIPFKIDEI